MTRLAKWNPASLDGVVRSLVLAQANLVEITTHATVGTLMEIEHSLGRVPLGYTLSDPPFAFVQYGHNSDDTAHTDRYLYIRFSVASTALKLLVF